MFTLIISGRSRKIRFGYCMYVFGMYMLDKSG
jgi:hypothetical protein